MAEENKTEEETDEWNDDNKTEIAIQKTKE